MARFLGMNTFAPTAILRYQMRRQMRKLRNEDKEILWEGWCARLPIMEARLLSSLTFADLR